MAYEFKHSVWGATYEVTIKMRDRLVGGVPKNPDVISDWLSANEVSGELPQTLAAMELTPEELKAMADAKADKLWTGFKRDENGYYIEARQLKAMLREGMQIQGFFKRRPGLRDFLQHEGLCVRPERIYVAPVGIALPFFEAVAHVKTMQGPRSALKRRDYVSKVELQFTLSALAADHQVPRKGGDIIDLEMIEAVLQHAQEGGLGADRSQHEGKFDVLAIVHK